jgi:UDP-glucose 4-epimerase
MCPSIIVKLKPNENLNLEEFNLKKILVTGGAGYIGSHVVKALSLENENILVLDDLSNGYKESVLAGELIVGNVGDKELLDKIFQENQIEGILHFAGSIVVPESVENPIKYFKNNTINSLTLIESAVKHGIENFIFSSTASVYGNANKNGSITEDSLPSPENPYAESKLMTERMLESISTVSDLNYVVLRYFNVAGADFDGQLGQRGENATHLIKVCSEAASGKRTEMTIYGEDYQTVDGTGVRDYIHVTDLANVHVEAFKYLRSGGVSQTLNCGYGKGFSVKEVVSMVLANSKNSFDVKIGARRPGDVGFLVADNSKLREVLNWSPEYNDLEKIVTSAINWESKL